MSETICGFCTKPLHLERVSVNVNKSTSAPILRCKECKAAISASNLNIEIAISKIMKNLGVS